MPYLVPMDGEGTSTGTEGQVLKSGCGPNLAVVGLTAVLAVIYFVANGSGQAETYSAALTSLAPRPTTTTTTTTPSPTVGANSLSPAVSTSTVAKQAQPERGLFREALANKLSAPCEDLIDGPEPVPDVYYLRHESCVTEALANLDERCRLAAAVFYVMPGEEAVDLACYDQGTAS